MKPLRILLILIPASLIGLTYLLGSYLTRASPETTIPTPSDLPTREITLQGTQHLSAWLIPHPEPRAQLLLLHGIRQNRTQMLDRARFLHQQGYQLLLPDLHGHGLSGGTKTAFGHRARKDAEAGVDLLKNLHPELPLGIIGSSMGAAAALLGNAASQADALILEAMFSDIESALENRLQIHLGNWAKHLSPLFLWQLKPRLGINATQLRPVDRISELEQAILLIRGTDDRHCQEYEQDRLITANPVAELWQLKGAQHEDLHAYAGKQYETRILAFLDQALFPAP